MSTIKPLVSIVLPTYNGSKYIRESIDSCLNQTYGNIELVIVDDGSTDGTGEIIKSYNDSRIKVIWHEKNKGLPNALNTGFSKATGEFLTWTSDDNYYAKDAIGKMVDFLNINKCDFVYCDYYIFNSDPTNSTLINVPEKLELSVHNGVGACFAYGKRVKDTIGEFSQDAKLAEDYDYWIRVSKKFKMLRLPEPLYYFRSHEGSLSIRFNKEYDISIMSILVRLDNGIIDIHKAEEHVIDLITDNRIMKNNISKRIESSRFNNLQRSTCRGWIKIRSHKKINIILTGIKSKTISISDSKVWLKKMITP